MSTGTEFQAAESRLIGDFMSQRRIVGWIGLLLPAVLIAGNTIFTTTLPNSISDYYFTHMRNILIASLCALGIFLICYSGYDAWDRWLTNVSGFGMIGVALCVPAPDTPVRLSTPSRIFADLHFCCATAALLAVTFMALRFTQSSATPDSPGPGVMNFVRAAFGLTPDGPGEPRTPAKQRRDRVYRACGFGMFGTMACAGLANIVPVSAQDGIPFLFIFESLTVMAFGVSWLVKGQSMVLPAALKDKQPASSTATDSAGSAGGAGAVSAGAVSAGAGGAGAGGAGASTVGQPSAKSTEPA